MSAGEFGDVAVEPVGYAKVASHLRHAQAQHRRRAADALQPEGKLVPYLIGHDLRVWVLHDEADASSLRFGRHLVQGDAVEQYGARALSEGGEHALELAQERRLAAAALAADAEVLAALDLETQLVKRGRRSIGIAEAQMLESEERHAIASFASMADGTSTSTVHAMSAPMPSGESVGMSIAGT